MKAGTEDRRKLTILGVVGIAAIAAAVYMYTQLSTPDAPPPSAPVVKTVAPAGTASSSAGTKVMSVTQLDPTLRMGPMLVTESLVYSGSGRNIFSGAPVEVAMVKPIAPARPKQVAVTLPPAPLGPPPPPPIDLKFFGTATSANGVRQAFLLKGEDVFMASSGDIVQRRYKVITISANSIEVEDLINNHRQTLPLLAN